MDAYQELLNERNRLAAEVAAKAVEINALEQSTAVRVGKRLKRFAPLMHQALHVARIVRNWHRKVRRPTRVAAVSAAPAIQGDGRPTVLVLVHKASAEACVQLARALMGELRTSYRVVAVMLGGDFDLAGAADVVTGPLQIGEDSYMKALNVAEGLAATYQPRFAIVSSGQAAHLGSTLSASGVPVIALMHELPLALTIPSNNARTLMDRADDIIFSGHAVQDLYRPFYKRMDYRRTHVIVPGQGGVAVASSLRQRLTYIAADCFLVVGSGAIEYRSGVDAFITTASVLRDQYPDTKFHFVWAGMVADTDYAAYLSEQIARAGLQDFVTLLYGAGFYGDADLIYATARLDYLPCAAVDYALAGKPIICFANSGGISEILAEERLVLPHMNVAAAAKIINELASDRAACAQLGQAMQAHVQEICAIGPYAQKLIALGEEAAAARSYNADTAQLLAQPGNFDAELYAGKSVSNRDKVIAEYLERVYYDGYRKRALAGFHPEYYASQTPEVKTQRLDPLTHYLQAGRPAGPWLHPIIRLTDRAAPAAATARVALHGHFYYVDQIGSLLQALGPNRSQVDLFLTTGSEDNRKTLLDATRDYKAGSVHVDIVPNKGRDIGPFLHLYRTRLADAYDIIGHVHGKKSVHTASFDPGFGERWRNFLFQHLIGPKLPVMDIILDAFGGDAKLGMMFPEDPNVFGWDFDKEQAQRLVERMGLDIALPPHIDFPSGTMFWARAAALAPLTRLTIDWEEYPPEPLPVDGTILHALERLLPSIARGAGFEYAATYFPGIER